MSSLSPIITDLAFILVVAGVTTLLFKWLKQPVVLGYIVAGFLVGPHATFFPTVSQMSSIDIWAEIGIIVLLFSLGLEFSFKKLLNVGGSALITASVVVMGMMLLGYSVGRLLHFPYLDSIFLGAMLSMSSTTIIIKAFTDLNLRSQKFTTLVFGVLIVEDLFAVLALVLLTSIAVNKQFEGSELIESVLKLGFFLISWFVVGTFIIPTLFKRVRKFLNAETLLILSMGLCLGMVVLASYVGFSSALGAFIMGSILAGTIEAERIEKEIRPVKDLFGAVFFISVGMMVDPSVLVEYTAPILFISAAVIIGQIVFATGGMLISGQSLHIAVRSGFSLAQIGEFAFIIATLGMTLHVIQPFLYPVVVAVSVITTFTTPYFIKIAVPICNYLDRKLPERVKISLDNYSNYSQAKRSGSHWKSALGKYAGRMLLYSTVIIGLIGISLNYFMPWICEVIPGELGLHIGVALSLSAMAPFLWIMSVKRIRNKYLLKLWQDKRANHVPVIVLIASRFAIALTLVVYFLSHVYSQRLAVLVGLFILFVLLILFSQKLQKRFYRIEKRFMDNLNERELRKTGRQNNLVNNLHLATMEVSAGSPFIGSRLRDANLNKIYGINVVSIKRGNLRINIPTGENRLFPGDVISVVGTDEQILRFLPISEASAEVAGNLSENTPRVAFEKIIIPPTSYLCDKTLSQSGIRAKSCLVVAIEREDGTFVTPAADVELKKQDMLWLVGEPLKIKALLNE